MTSLFRMGKRERGGSRSTVDTSPSPGPARRTSSTSLVSGSINVPTLKIPGTPPLPGGEGSSPQASPTPSPILGPASARLALTTTSKSYSALPQFDSQNVPPIPKRIVQANISLERHLHMAIQMEESLVSILGHLSVALKIASERVNKLSEMFNLEGVKSMLTCVDELHHASKTTLGILKFRAVSGTVHLPTAVRSASPQTSVLPGGPIPSLQVSRLMTNSGPIQSAPPSSISPEHADKISPPPPENDVPPPPLPHPDTPTGGSQDIPWIATIYSQPHYTAAFRKFLASTDSLLSTAQVLKFQSAASPLPSSTIGHQSSLASQMSLEELMWAVASRPQYIASLARAQRDVAVAAACMDDIETNGLKCERVLSSIGFPLPPVSQFPEWLPEEVNISIDILNDLAEASAQVDETYTPVDILRSTEMPPNALQIISAGRKLLRASPLSLYLPTEFGLSVELPIVLTMFSDGIAILMQLKSASTKYRFKLLNWYPLDTLFWAEVKPSQVQIGAPQVFQLANRKPNIPPPSPTGADAHKNKEKRSSLHLASNFTALEGLSLIIAPSKEVKDEWLASLRTYVTECEPNTLETPHPMFGIELDDLMTREESAIPNHKVPVVIKKVLYRVLSDNVAQQGLFRVAGEKKLVEEFVKNANAGITKLNESWENTKNVDVLASVLKKFLRELPTPLLTEELHDKFMAAASITPKSDQLKELSALLYSLPRRNRALFRELLSFFATIAANEHINSMNSQNLAIVIAPNVLRDKQGSTPEDLLSMTSCSKTTDILQAYIQNYADIFEGHSALVPSESSETDFVTFRRKLVGHAKSVRSACRVGAHTVWSIDSDGMVYVWDTEKCAYVKNFETGVSNLSCMEAVKDQAWIGTCSGVVVFDTVECKKIGEINGFLTICILPVGDHVWIGGEGMKVFDAKTREKVTDIAPIADGATVHSMILVNQDVWAAGHAKGENQLIHIWDIATMKLKHKFAAHKKRIGALALANNRVWSASEDNTMAVWNVDSYKVVHRLERHKQPVFGFAVMPDQVWSCSSDMSIMIWDMHSLKYVGEIRGYHTDKVKVLLPTSSTEVWSASFDGSICAWTVKPIPCFVPPDPKINTTPNPSLNTLRRQPLVIGPPSQPPPLSLAK